MNNRAFTIIEFIGIILVLSLIFLVSFPALQNMAKNDLEKSYDKMVDNLCLAGEAYINANEENFSNKTVVNSIINISIDELILYGNVDSTLNNPKTKLSVSGDSLVYTVLSDYTLNCEYRDN